ncbi:MAG: DUF4296 domain-containing protein [Ginsengibacter sp.]
MRRLFTICILLILITSCGKKDDIPKDIIPSPKMEALLWDVLRADMLAEENVKKDSTKNLNMESHRLNELIYQIHHVSEADFKRSISFYEARPELLRTIFDSLNAKQTRKDTNKSGYLKNHRPIDNIPFDKRQR